MSVQHYENFPVASWLCPRPLRPAITAIYWYARTADDLADEGADSPGTRLENLAAYRADLDATVAGHAVSARWREVFDPLGRCIRVHDLPIHELHALLSAFEQDVIRHRYESRDELIDYCRRSADPIGRLLLHLYGVRDERARLQSDAICSALQLINFWQDLSVDVARDRVYLPLQDCRRHGVLVDDLLAGRDSPALRSLLAELAQWTQALMQQGAPLVKQLPGRLGWELRLVVQGGLRILDQLSLNGFDSLYRRPKLTPRDFPPMAWRALRM